MAEQVLMIALSPTMEEGTVVRWNKKEGEFVNSGDVLCEVETDKATMDYESTMEGTLLKILVQEGEQAAIGEVIAVIGEEGENIDDLLESIKSEKSGIKGGGSSSDQAEESPEIHVKTEKIKADAGTAADSRIKASPLARRIAEVNNLPLDRIKGSGPDGRIIKADVEKYMEKKAAPEVSVRSIPPYAVQPSSGDELIPASAARKVIARRLSESKYSAPHYYLTVTAAVDKLIDTRKRINESLPDKISFNAFIIKYAAEAIKKHRMINAAWQDDNILIRKQIDIGLAVALPDGLITPVVRDCGNKGIKEIDGELRKLIEKARNNKLTPEEYQNAGFTISNLGSFGIEEFTAIINPPGSAILAVGEMKKMPVVDEEDNIKVQTQMKLTLSCDHRVIDGAVGAAFLKDLKDIIEDPFRALL